MAITAKLTRGGMVESLHTVYAVALDEHGKIIYNSGDPDYVTCARSSLKPFQAAASIREGAVQAVGFLENEMALMCASHNGEEIHAKTARSMLDKLGLDESYFECGNHLPYDKNSRENLMRSHEKINPLYNNCSGKHAGMLSLAKHLNADPNGYVNRDHPVQETIFRTLEEYTGHSNIPSGVDGCSAPTPFLQLSTLAQLFLQLAQQDRPEYRQVYDAMVNHPYLIGGKNRFDTDLIKITKGKVISKVGGEAVQGIGLRLRNGKTYSLAFKVLDGNGRVLPPTILAVLNHLQLVSADELEQLDSWANVKLLNHRKIVIGDILVDLD
jgi:L-asparaginase II